MTSLGRLVVPRRLLSALVCAAALGCADADVGPLAIGEVRSLPAGTTATIEGVATVSSGDFRSFTGENGLFVQDDTGGIYVSSNENPGVSETTLVRVTGVRGSLFQLETLDSAPGAIRPLEIGPLPPARDVTTGSVGPANEGSLVRVVARVTRGIGDDLPYGYKFWVDDGSGEVQIYVAASAFDPTGLDFLDPGARISAVGVSGRYEDTPELLPRSPADLKPADSSR